MQDGIHLTIAGPDALAPEDWQAHMALMPEDFSQHRELSVTEGALPSTEQRNAIKKLVSQIKRPDARPRIAVVTENPLVRVTLSGLARIMRKTHLEVYSLKQLPEALAFLGVTDRATQERILGKVQSMRLELRSERPPR